jgi:hypothetical protein
MRFRIGLGFALSAVLLACTATVAGASAGSGGPTVIGPNLRVPPRLGTQPVQQSLNWSGYAVTSKLGKFNYVHSRFIQPAITCKGSNPTTSNWVGLDGYTSGTVEQDGTLAYCNGNSKVTHYQAWYEFYPEPLITVFNVRPGDTIDALVKYRKGKFTLTVADLTRHKSVSHSGKCSNCARSSAEWIVERPELCSNSACTAGFLPVLPNFGVTTMSQDWASIDGGSVSPVRRFTKWPINMVQRDKKGKITQLDSVGSLFSGGSAFSVKWLAKGGRYDF